MNRMILIVLFITSGIKATYAQDLIVTKQADSIHCMIIKKESKRIYFRNTDSAGLINRSLPTEEVVYFKKGFFTPDAALKEKKRKNYSRFQVEARGGWSSMIAPLRGNFPEEFLDYAQKLYRNGYHYTGTFRHFFHRNLGIGLEYGITKFKHEKAGLSSPSSIPGGIKTGDMKDNITLQFIGASFCARRGVNNRFYLFLNGLLGYNFYKDNVVVESEWYIITSSNAALKVDLGAGMYLSKSLALTLHCSLTGSSLQNITYKTMYGKRTLYLNSDEAENISRVEVGLGLVWRR